jgi:prepilin-type N-terminal cleavage/methylation domain-containing protein
MTKRRIHHRRCASGFSLIESVIALSIFALLSVALTSALWTGRAIEQAAMKETDDLAQTLQLRAVFEPWLRALTLSAEPAQSAFEEPRVQPAFVGDQRQMQFSAVLDASLGRFGIYSVMFRIEPKAERGSRLVVERRSIAAAEGTMPDHAVLFESNGLLQFAYLAQQNQSNTGPGVSRRMLQNTAWEDLRRTPRQVMLLDETGRVLAMAEPAVDIRSGCVAREGEAAIDNPTCRLR